MTEVEGGTFQMGSPATEQGRDEDECQHLVPVASFSMGRYEVTQADWRDIMGDSPSKHRGCDDCPVEQVSWDTIQTFLQKLNALYPNKNYRLPTEAEWEYAARGGKKSAGYTYAGSDTLGKVAWYLYNGSGETHPVGGKATNELGLYDMSGNVWEWCQDVCKAYPNCKGSVVDNWRRNRGGSAFGYAVYCRSAGRASLGSPYSNPTVGFRLCSDSLQ